MTPFNVMPLYESFVDRARRSFSAGNFQDAKRCWQIALMTSEQLNPPAPYKLQCLMGLAMTLQSLDDLAGAEIRARQALKVARLLYGLCPILDYLKRLNVLRYFLAGLFWQQRKHRLAIERLAAGALEDATAFHARYPDPAHTAYLKICRSQSKGFEVASEALKRAKK